MPFRGQGAICSGHSLLPCVCQAAPLHDQGLTAGGRHCPNGHSSARSASGRTKALSALGELPGLALPSHWRLSSRWDPTGLSEVSATWKYVHASLLTQHSSLGWSHQETAPDGRFIASWTVAWDLV